jgi:hypothetical protein
VERKVEDEERERKKKKKNAVFVICLVHIK